MTLLGLNDEQFMAVVLADIRDATDDEVAEALAGDLETVERWCTALGQHVNVLNQQFSDRKARIARLRDECWAAGAARKAEWFEADAEYQSWKHKTTRYKGHVQAKLAEAKALRTEMRRTAAAERDDVLLQALLTAVRQHRDAVAGDARPADIELWRCLP